MIEGRLLVAYHGCDITTRDDLVTGKLVDLDHSRNPYDWLGPGVYFFEGDAKRALMFAKASYDNPAKMYTARAIGTPAVVGAILRVQRWLDMTTQEGINEFTLAYPALLAGLAKTGSPVLRDNSCVEGWFLPRGAQLLHEAEYLEAVARREQMAINRKPKKRAGR